MTDEEYEQKVLTAVLNTLKIEVKTVDNDIILKLPSPQDYEKSLLSVCEVVKTVIALVNSDENL